MRKQNPMPRRSRLQIAGLPLHIIQRGNIRQACFFADDDYLFFLELNVRVIPQPDCGARALQRPKGQPADGPGLIPCA